MKTLTDHEKHSIEWIFFENLAQYRVQNDYVTHKITRAHVECHRNKMKVSLAAELLSRSAANSLAYLMSCGLPDFQNCSATIQFISKMNALFDVLNTGCNDTLSNNNNNVFKAPLCAESAPTSCRF